MRFTSPSISLDAEFNDHLTVRRPLYPLEPAIIGFIFAHTPPSFGSMTAEFKRGDRFVYRHIAGEHLLVALHQDRAAPLFTFSPTGASLWHELADWSSAERLTEHLVDQYDVSREDASRDVTDFLEQLSSLNALETREVAP
jgi:hypothetical protein